jgi:hypothetical protein
MVDPVVIFSKHRFLPLVVPVQREEIHVPQSDCLRTPYWFANIVSLANEPHS